MTDCTSKSSRTAILQAHVELLDYKIACIIVFERICPVLKSRLMSYINILLLMNIQKGYATKCIANAYQSSRVNQNLTLVYKERGNPQWTQNGLHNTVIAPRCHYFN